VQYFKLNLTTIVWLRYAENIR